MPIIAAIVFLTVTGIGLVNGVLMMYDPRLWIEKVNAFYRFFMGKTPWFQLSDEGLSSPFNYWGTRVAGLLMAYYCGFPFLRFLSMLAGICTGDNSLVFPPARQDLQSHQQSPPSVIATAVMLALSVVLGACFVAFPKRTLTALGMNRWIKDSTPLFVWRLLGVGIIVVGVQGLRGFAR
jgi:hypothetical protein